MPWVEVFAVFMVCHLGGDFLLQTEWQATMKRGGLGPDPERRRALASHAITYTLAFAPALAWLAGDVGAAGVLGAVAAIAVPHAVQDDGRLVVRYARSVKGMEPQELPTVMLLLDQALHVVVLFGLALMLGG